MSNYWPLFMFLAAVGVALFAFVSIAAWSGSNAAQRQAHDRYALLRSLAEQPGENARLVLEMLRDQDERKAQKKEEEERRGFLIGGLVCIATGISLVTMFTVMGAAKAWPVGLIPLFIGLVITPFGLPRRKAAAGSRSLGE